MLSNEKGLTLIEILVTVAISAILIAGLNGLVGGIYEQWQYGNSRQELLSQGNFAMARILKAVNATRRVFIPFPMIDPLDDSKSKRSVLAVTLDPGLDRDVDGFFDGDNDKDGLIDEDIPADNTFDGAPGIIGIDDDNDSVIDENIGGKNFFTDNDEDGLVFEDCLDGIDNDNDGYFDEDIPSENRNSGGKDKAFDNDGDAIKKIGLNEDWLDPVVYFVNSDNTKLIERMPNVNPTDGTDFSEYPIAEADSIKFTVERLLAKDGNRAELLLITLVLKDYNADDNVTFKTSLRIGGGR